MELLPEVQKIMETLNQNDFEGYLIGECVRDYWMEKESYDFDICTNATPKEIRNIFPKGLFLGINSEIVQVIVEDKIFKITTFQRKAEEESNREAKSIELIEDLTEDLKRRNFTINAMAYHLKEGIIDPFHGKQDIYSRLVRTVGDPNKQFSKDPICMIRAICLATILDFKIEEKTLQALKENVSFIQTVPCDRLRYEFNKILASENSWIGLLLMKETGMLPYLFDLPDFQEIEQKWKQEMEILEQDLKQANIDILEIEDKIKVNLAIIWYHISCLLEKKEECLEKCIELTSCYLKKYNYPKMMSKEILEMIKCYGMLPTNIEQIDEKYVKKLMDQLEDKYSLYLTFMNAIDRGEVIHKICALEKCIDQSSIHFNRSDLALNSNDLIALGFPKNYSITLALNELLGVVLENPNLNTKENLKSYLTTKGIASFIENNPFFKERKNAQIRFRSEMMLNQHLQEILDGKE